MSRTVTDLIAQLLFPPCGPMLIVALGILSIRRGPRIGLVIACLGFGLLWTASLELVGISLLTRLEHPPAQETELGGVQTIVVLGAGVVNDSPEYAKATVPPHALARVRYAAYLAKKTGASVIVVGGRPESGRVSEAEVMADSLKNDFGIQSKWLETTSTTTAENAKSTRSVLGPEKIDRIALITTAWHMDRAASAFEAAGFSVVAAPTGYLSRRSLRVSDFLPSAAGLAQTRDALWEVLGLFWYQLRGDAVRRR